MRAKDIFFHSLILLTIIGTAALGVWQLQRREWKHELLTRLEYSYALAPEILSNETENLAYTRKIIQGSCAAKNFLYQPGKYHGGQPGENVFCVIKTGAGENLLVQLGWANTRPVIASVRFHQPALLLPFSPRPWWMPQSANSNEMMWPAEPSGPAYPVYAVLESNHDQPLLHTDIIPTGAKPELPDDHLQYAITWFTLAAVLLTLYIYRACSSAKP